MSKNEKKKNANKQWICEYQELLYYKDNKRNKWENNILEKKKYFKKQSMLLTQ